MFQGINVVAIPVPDLSAGKAFYAETLGLGAPLYDLPDDGWIEFSAGAPGGNIAITPAPEGWVPGDTGIVLNVADCATAVAALRDRGVDCDDPQTFTGYVVFAGFRDPFGNRLQICSPA